MPNYVIYDNNGNVLKYGMHTRRTLNRLKKDGVNILEINSMIKGMDVTHKVKNKQIMKKRLL